ncbi:hypothetical protein AGMMS49921_08920 [Endomicrobiia bacterium]|nr:hypothetical protein AGMMS49921_08920 [Endomicrobiia bacterium]
MYGKTGEKSMKIRTRRCYKHDCVICSCDKKNALLVNRRTATPEKIEAIKEAKRIKAQAATDAKAQRKAEVERSVVKSIYITDPEPLVGDMDVNGLQLRDPNAGPRFEPARQVQGGGIYEIIRDFGPLRGYGCGKNKSYEIFWCICYKRLCYY